MNTGGRVFSSALLLDDKGSARELSDDEVYSWKAADGVLWVDFNQSSRKAREWLLKDSGVDRGVASILMEGETRPRSLAEAGGLVVIMRGINMNPGAEPDDMVAVRIWLDNRLIITARRRKVLSIADVRDSLLAGKGPKTVGKFLIAITGRLTDRIADAVDNIERLLEDLDATLAEGDVDAVRSKLSVVRRQAAAIRRHLAPQRDALDRLARSSTALLNDKEQFELREEGDHLTRHIEDLDLARENALVTQEELMNRVALEQNARMYLLSVVAAIFLPLGFLTGLLGMNVAGLPGTVNPYGFMISAAVMISVGIGLVAYFKWKRWI